MIHGTRFATDRDRYYIQTNNPTEQLLKKREGEGWLESCGPSAAVNCLATLGYDLVILCPGVYKPQPEEVLMDFFNDPKNYAKFAEIRKDLDPVSFPGNRVPQWYPYAVQQVFAATASFVWGSELEKITQFLKRGFAVQLCLKKPGHYIAVVAYDDETNELIFNDSWPDRFPDKNGFNRRMGADEYKRNVKPWAILYMKEGA